MTQQDMIEHQQNGGVFYSPYFTRKRFQVFRISSFDFETNLYYKEQYPNNGEYVGYSIDGLQKATGTQAALFLQREKEAKK